MGINEGRWRPPGVNEVPNAVVPDYGMILAPGTKSRKDIEHLNFFPHLKSEQGDTIWKNAEKKLNPARK